MSQRLDKRGPVVNQRRGNREPSRISGGAKGLVVNRRLREWEPS